MKRETYAPTCGTCDPAAGGVQQNPDAGPRASSVFGQKEIHCEVCSLGPCAITDEKTRGTCGANADLVVARNILRAAAMDAADHGARVGRSMLALKQAADNEISLPVAGSKPVSAMATEFGFPIKEQSLETLAGQVADTLFEDMNRVVSTPHKVIDAAASPERRLTWFNRDLLPVGLPHEVFEALHQPTVGTQDEWRMTVDRLMRLGIAFSVDALMGGSIARDALYDKPKKIVAKANLSALDGGAVNIAIHDVSPELLDCLVQAARSEEFRKSAEQVGATGIRLYGVCLSDLSLENENCGLIPLCNVSGSEVALSSRALDLWLADSRLVLPGIMNVADCHKTVVATVGEKEGMAGAEHFGGNDTSVEMDDLAGMIVSRAIESFAGRRDVRRDEELNEVVATLGISLDALDAHYGCLERVASALINGQIKGIVILTGCANTSGADEKALLNAIDLLLENDILVFASGCAAMPLVKSGRCSKKALDRCGDKLQMFLKGELPPVWHFGECVDNANALHVFREIAKYAGNAMKDLPFAYLSPEWSGDKGVVVPLAYRMSGFDSYHCAPDPVSGSEAVRQFICEGARELVGSSMKWDSDPQAVAEMIIADFAQVRSDRCWR
tara:strand:+ start:14358 stop:16205 length:1848 start_codon:yes stop_codon:yes gene_type:complete